LELINAVDHSDKLLRDGNQLFIVHLYVFGSLELDEIMYLGGNLT